ncbi:MAG: DUF4129 domain-containing protein [Candidatus Helarchaeota archaeon]|nr:DUF4129 domain-containing protein [Candidatus Helarchaeota archaeon]
MARREKKKKKKKKTGKVRFEGINMSFIKGKLESLQQGKRFQEAIIYAYYNYLQLVQNRYKVPRRPGQTAREYAMAMVKQVKIPPTMLYPFTTLFEEARFGNQQTDINKLNEAIQLFVNLHDRIMGGPKQVGTEGAPTA